MIDVTEEYNYRTCPNCKKKSLEIIRETAKGYVKGVFNIKATLTQADFKCYSCFKIFRANEKELKDY